MSDKTDPEPQEPVVSPKDDEPEGFCQVTCICEGLTVTTGLSKGKIVKKPDGGKVLPEFDTRSFKFSVTFKDKKKKLVKYGLEVKKLPGEIIPEECKVKVVPNNVIISLKKAKDESWTRALETKGIEQFTEEEEEKPDE